MKFKRQRNKLVGYDDKAVMLQVASMYTTGDGTKWKPEGMFKVMLKISETSLQLLGRDLFKQITEIKETERI